jgi:hypothetical protein
MKWILTTFMALIYTKKVYLGLSDDEDPDPTKNVRIRPGPDPDSQFR